MFKPLLLLALVVLALAEAGADGSRVKISGGSFTPLYGSPADGSAVHIDPFEIDRFPVTNREFVNFTLSHPEWKRGAPGSLRVDGGYLKHLTGSSQSHAPVTNVSWHAARAFCATRGGRLPTVYEWEFVAAADEQVKDATRDPRFVQKLLAWYSEPHTELAAVGESVPNVWGIYDLHGLVWEWTEDFNSVFVAGDNRRDGEQVQNLFCGGGAVSANDRSNYAAFMRYALRNSLEGNFTLENLGFRCAYSEVKEAGR